MPTKRNCKFYRVPHTLGRLSNSYEPSEINLYLSHNQTFVQQKAGQVFQALYSLGFECMCVLENIFDHKRSWLSI